MSGESGAPANHAAKVDMSVSVLLMTSLLLSRQLPGVKSKLMLTSLVPRTTPSVLWFARVDNKLQTEEQKKRGRPGNEANTK